MKYIIDEGELKEMLYASDYSSEDVEEIIADKKPVIEIASGKPSYEHGTITSKSRTVTLLKVLEEISDGKSITIFIQVKE